ncbi:MAG: FprA family A-type flavoprotein [Roseburia sp.]|nr:FprA family A-type flavoprotein [Roseburia sp.]
MEKITNDLIYVGVDDLDIDLFEGQFPVANGMAYNSYVLLDEKTAVIDTVDGRFCDRWLDNVRAALGGRKPDYLIVDHMESDHSANMDALIAEYPDVTVVGNAKTFAMAEAFFGKSTVKNALTVSDGEKLSLGKHELTFVFAPMVHWPEVMMTYDALDKTLFSADAFGKFGTRNADDEWTDEARRYYFGIVGKFGAQVKSALAKLATYDIKRICATHGPILDGELSAYIQKYALWSEYRPERDGVLIAYTSIYGHTEAAVNMLAAKLKEKGVSDVKVYDLARCDRYAAIADAFSYAKIALATTTYNGGIFPAMREFIDALTERNFQNRTIGLVENGAWAPTAANAIKAKFEKSKDITFAPTSVKIRAALADDSKQTIDALAAELSE